MKNLFTDVIPITSLFKMGFHKNYPKAVVYGPVFKGGLNMVDLTIEDGVRGITHFLHHMYSKDSIAKLIHISLQIMQLEADRGQDLFMDSSIYISYVTPTWITNLRSFMEQHNLRIRLKDPWKLTLQCENDQFIMEMFTVKKISSFKLFHLNCCRMYLNVLTLADITTADGLSIRQDIVECRLPRDRKSPLVWPNQPEPTPQQKSKWKAGLLSCMLKSASRELLQLTKLLLGQWLGTFMQKWKFRYSVSTQQLWEKRGHRWLIHEKVSSHRRFVQCMEVGY